MTVYLHETTHAPTGSVTVELFDTVAGTVTTTVDGTQTDQRALTADELAYYQTSEQAQYGTPEVMVSALLREYGSTQDPTTAPPWVQPLGSHDAYLPGALVAHGGATWRNDLTVLNVWEPGTQGAGWFDLTPPPEGAQPWAQPTGGHDAYNVGDEVTHVGSTWQSNVAGNVWEPGVYGWITI